MVPLFLLYSVNGPPTRFPEIAKFPRTLKLWTRTMYEKNRFFKNVRFSVISFLKGQTSSVCREIKEICLKDFFIRWLLNFQNSYLNFTLVYSVAF